MLVKSLLCSQDMFNSHNHHIYLDYMASTPVDPQVSTVMCDYHRDYFGNPFSIHGYGLQAGRRLDQAMAGIAKVLQCPAKSLQLTSGATESNSLAIHGVVTAAKKNGIAKPHVIVSAIEHPSVAGVGHLQDSGMIEVDFLPVDSSGIIEIKNLQDLLRPTTVLVSVMLVNSEIGTIQPLNEVAKVIKRYQGEGSTSKTAYYPLLHTDASQAALTLDLNLRKLHVDLLTINGHKIYAPIGMGLLYVNPVVAKQVEPLFVSNYEKTYIRPGTVSVANALALEKALALTAMKRDNFIQHATKLFNFFTEGLQQINGSINGSMDLMSQRVPNNVSVSFPSINHEYLQLQLDAVGVYCATRSACLESGSEGSAVLSALDSAGNRNALRFSFGYNTTKSDLAYVLAQLQKAMALQTSI